VVQAPAPARLIEGGLPTERLVAHVVVAKYADHCPLYREAQILARQGITIDRATLTFWVGGACPRAARSADPWAAAEIKPVWRLLRNELLSSTKLFVDETTAPVLDPGRGRTKKGYFWVLARDDRPWRGGAPPAVVYSYSPGRSGEHAVTLLQGLYRGAADRPLCRLPQPCRSEARRRAGYARVLLGTLAQAVVRHCQIAAGANCHRGPQTDRRTLRDRSRDPRQQRRRAPRGPTAENQTALQLCRVQFRGRRRQFTLAGHGKGPQCVRIKPAFPG
jgi:Transposase IS66 family